MLEISRHWRLRHQRLRPLSGSRRVLEDGTVQFRLPGSSNWVEANHNGHHKNEDPFEGRLIYQAPSEESVMPLEIHAEVEISTT